MCTDWVKSLRAGLQLPPGHKGEAGTHLRKLKSLGGFLARAGIAFGWVALQLAGWGRTQGCLCAFAMHRQVPAARRGWSMGGATGAFHVAQG